MPANLTDVNVYTTPIVVPADGDVESAASIIAGFQGVANRGEFLRNRVKGAYSTGIEFEVPLSGPQASSGFTFSASGWLTQSTVTGSEFVNYRLDPPPGGGKITGIRARFLPIAGHAAVPAGLPSLLLLSFPTTLGLTTVSATTLALVSGTYANTTAYQQVVDVSTVTSGALPVTLAASTAYVLQLVGEAGANSIAGLKLLGLFATWSN